VSSNVILKIGIFICLLPLSGIWNDFQPALLSLILIASFSLGNNLNLEIIYRKRVALFLFFFVVYSFLSFFWARNPSLIWPEAFGMLLSLLWYLCVSQSTIESKKLLLFVQQVAMYIYLTTATLLIIYILVSSKSHLDVLGDIRKIGYNTNYFICSLLFLFSIMLIPRTFRWRLVALSYGMVSLLYLAYVFRSRGVLLTMGILVILHVGRLYFRRYTYYRNGLIIVFLASLFLLNTGMVKEKRAEYYSRSVKAWSHNPVLGIGGGNWHAVYAFPSSNSHYDKSSLYNRRSHSLFLKCMVEYGGIGLLLILFILIAVVKNYSEMDGFYKEAFLAPVIVFFVFSLIYNFHITQLRYFSFFQMSILGILAACTKSYSNEIFVK